VGVAGEGLKVEGEDQGARAEAAGEHVLERGLAHAALAGEEEGGAAVVGEVVVDEVDEVGAALEEVGVLGAEGWAGLEGGGDLGVLAFEGGKALELVVDDVEPEADGVEEAAFQVVGVALVGEGDTVAFDRTAGSGEEVASTEVVGGEVGGGEVLGGGAEAVEGGGGLGRVVGTGKEVEVEGGGEGPGAIAGGAFEGAGAKLAKGAERRTVLSEGAESLVDESLGEAGVAISEGDEEGADAGKGEADQVVVAEGQEGPEGRRERRKHPRRGERSDRPCRFDDVEMNTEQHENGRRAGHDAPCRTSRPADRHASHHTDHHQFRYGVHHDSGNSSRGLPVAHTGGSQPDRHEQRPFRLVVSADHHADHHAYHHAERPSPRHAERRAADHTERDTDRPLFPSGVPPHRCKAPRYHDRQQWCYQEKHCCHASHEHGAHRDPISEQMPDLPWRSILPEPPRSEELI
jgi:hypothetical protein